MCVYINVVLRSEVRRRLGNDSVLRVYRVCASTENTEHTRNSQNTSAGETTRPLCERGFPYVLSPARVRREED